jgi:hypothetical protein
MQTPFKTLAISVSLSALLLAVTARSQPVPAPLHKRMTVVDIYDAGQPQAIILKLFDPGSDVVCYVLVPEQAARKEVGGKWIYEGNAVGSISCVPVALK